MKIKSLFIKNIFFSVILFFLSISSLIYFQYDSYLDSLDSSNSKKNSLNLSISSLNLKIKNIEDKLISFKSKNSTFNSINIDTSILTKEFSKIFSKLSSSQDVFSISNIQVLPHPQFYNLAIIEFDLNPSKKYLDVDSVKILMKKFITNNFPIFKKNISFKNSINSTIHSSFVFIRKVNLNDKIKTNF
jgi:hypothetical protein